MPEIQAFLHFQHQEIRILEVEARPIVGLALIQSQRELTAKAYAKTSKFVPNMVGIRFYHPKTIVSKFSISLSSIESLPSWKIRRILSRMTSITHSSTSRSASKPLSADTRAAHSTGLLICYSASFMRFNTNMPQRNIHTAIGLDEHILVEKTLASFATPRGATNHQN